jgi:predicted dehydrogenase
LKKEIGIIGCGAVTEQFYLKTLPLIETVRIKYLADRDIERAKKLAVKMQAEATTDLEELRKGSDIVIVCTPPDSHYSLVKDSLSKGKIVICEKPFLTQAKQVTELVELAKKVDAKILVAHFRRTYPSVQLAKSLIETSNLGVLKSISISEGGRFNWSAVSDYFLTNNLGGVALDTGSHTIDMALYVAQLDTQELIIKSIDIKKDKVEPSHEVDAKLLTEVNGNPLEININLSRYKALANQIVFKFENGKITIPTSLSSLVKVQNDKRKVIVYSNEKLKNAGFAFYEQYKRMLVNNKADDFSAERFYNLVNILETINNA